MVTVKVRPATISDLRFVAASWYADYWSRWGKKHCERDKFHKGQGARIDRLLGRSHVLVAYLPEVPDEVLGWLCLDIPTPTVHYCYVKGEYRRMGIASGLMQGQQADSFSHSVDTTGGAFASKFNLKFDPYTLEST